MKKSVVHISDHALVRYLERVLLFDVEGLRRQIGREVDKCLIDQLPMPARVKSNGVSYRLRGTTVTTCTRVRPHRGWKSR